MLVLLELIETIMEVDTYQNRKIMENHGKSSSTGIFLVDSPVKTGWAVEPQPFAYGGCPTLLRLAGKLWSPGGVRQSAMAVQRS